MEKQGESYTTALQEVSARRVLQNVSAMPAIAFSSGPELELDTPEALCLYVQCTVKGKKQILRLRHAKREL
jgi:hypothetical protein